jgi:Ca2+-binding EF-hand superfamily protein
MEFDLKEVFSILDENDEGQIQLRRFIDVANNYYSDAEVSAFEFLIETTVQKCTFTKEI